MDLEKLTERARAFLQNAQGLAQRSGHQRLTPEHLLKVLLDDEEGKPEDIELFIGQKPLAAFGNSEGDRQMLEWTQAGAGARFMMLIHHDDAEREYAYGPNSKIGTFPDALMAEANQRGWIVTSMKQDWKVIFPFQK